MLVAPSTGTTPSAGAGPPPSPSCVRKPIDIDPHNAPDEGPDHLARAFWFGATGGLSTVCDRRPFRPRIPR
jgi:hypothetical protein